MVVGVAVGAGVSDTTTDAEISSGVCSPVSSEVTLAVSSCMLDNPETTPSSGVTAGVTETGLDTTTSWTGTDKLFALGVNVSLAEAERAAEACELSSLSVGTSSTKVVLMLSRANCKKMHPH